MIKNPHLSPKYAAIIRRATWAANAAEGLASAVLAVLAGLLLVPSLAAAPIPTWAGLGVALAAVGVAMVLAAWLGRWLDAKVAQLADRYAQLDTTA